MIRHRDGLDRQRRQKIGAHYWPEFLVIKSVDIFENERMLIVRTLLAPTHCCVTPTLTLC